LVARQMPERVVVGLEAVQVEHRQRPRPVLSGGCQGCAKIIDQRTAVGEVGQSVVQRLRPPVVGPIWPGFVEAFRPRDLADVCSIW
jgi:hypothetical protein